MMSFPGPYVKGGSIDGGGTLSGPISNEKCPECGTTETCGCHEVPSGVCAECYGTGSSGGAEIVRVGEDFLRMGLVSRRCPACGGAGDATR